MQFLTENANIFYISAAEIARNELAKICHNIRQRIVLRNGTYSFIFIEEPPFRWGHEVKRQMLSLHASFDDEYVIHDLILPSDVYKEMKFRNHEYDEPIEELQA